MGVFRRIFRRIGQSDEERLTEEVRDWAGSVPDTTRIEGCPERSPVRIAGVVRRITLLPAGDDGVHSLRTVVHDGTGEIIAVWTGRDQIPGLHLGTRVVLEGLAARERDALRMVNPRFEFV
ncbi:MAG TPA: hypothetical protein VE669_04180 [Actinomycetota bacterium]|nr:hypothetical protein [Actinomycetota bacterium]